MKTELTISESQHLIDLGVDPKMASRCQYVEKISSGVRGIIQIPKPKPIFDLSDVIGILPKEIEKRNNPTMRVVYYWNPNNKKWGVYYDYAEDCEIYTAPELIDSLYQLLCWWLERKSKTEEK